LQRFAALGKPVLLGVCICLFWTSCGEKTNQAPAQNLEPICTAPPAVFQEKTGVTTIQNTPENPEKNRHLKLLPSLKDPIGSTPNRREKAKSEPPPQTIMRQSAQAETRLQALWQAQIMRECVQPNTPGMGTWQFVGPGNIGGRITDVLMHPTDTNTLYAASASGGVFKSGNGGKNWIPLFDDQLSLAVGSIAIDPKNAATLYAGTGEANAGGGSITYDGTGIYKSPDWGKTWQCLGLQKTGSIARIAVNQQNEQILYAAAMGSLFKNNAERGLYKSINGGKTWEKTLFVSDSTGCADVVLHPTNSDVVYAAMWERIRQPHRRKYGGATGGIYRSTNGGKTWQKLTTGLPTSDIGRIGIAVSASKPSIVYAVYANQEGVFNGVYKSINGGTTWQRVNDRALRNLYENYGWWFGRIYVHPTQHNTVYVLGLELFKSDDGGQTWQNITSPVVHIDQQALFLHPLNPNLMLLGNDGGLCITHNGGNTWQALPSPPTVQFYTCHVSLQKPNRLYGGSQDNGILLTKSGLPYDWEVLIEGDGFGIQTDPANPNRFYAAYQYGNLLRTSDDGQQFYGATYGISNNDRTNWNAPFLIDPKQSHILYYGTNRVYKSTDHAAQWTPISPNLTKTAVQANVVYGTLTTLAVAPANTNYLYAGTDDGNLWHTPDGGKTWNDITRGLPAQWVSRIAVNPIREKSVYVAFSGYRQNSLQPYLYYSANAGKTWKNITANLPEAPVNAVLVYPADTATLFAATDVGVFVSLNGGNKWFMVGSNLPLVPVNDLCLHTAKQQLIAATYGRGMFTFSLTENPWRNSEK